MYEIKWDERALGDLQRLERNISSRIYKKVNSLRERAYSKDVKKIQGTNKFRLRVGDYRVIFSVQKEKITIWKVGHRKKIYKN